MLISQHFLFYHYRFPPPHVVLSMRSLRSLSRDDTIRGFHLRFAIVIKIHKRKFVRIEVYRRQQPLQRSIFCIYFFTIIRFIKA